MNSKKVLVSIFFISFSQVCSSIAPKIILSVASQVLKSLSGDRLQKAAIKLDRKLDKALGNDVSIGDVATMDVDMVSIVEPYDKHAIVTDYLAEKAATGFGHLEPITMSIFNKERIVKSKQDITQTFLNELIGTYIVLNESESASMEVLLSMKPCLLSNSDNFFNSSSDPCRVLAKEIASRIIERFLNVEKLRSSLGNLLKFSSEWDSHLRFVYLRLDLYIQDLDLGKSLKSSWSKIKDHIEAKRVL